MVSIENIWAYNVKLKTSELMNIDTVIKTPIMKQGSKTGKFRYRLAGTGSDGTGMSRFIGQKDANSISRQLGKPIEERAAKPATRRKTCKRIGETAKERCNLRRAAKRASKKAPTPIRRGLGKGGYKRYAKKAPRKRRK